MANVSRVNGFRPIRHISGSPWNGAMEIYYHSTANASAIYKGSAVLGATGLAGAGSDPLGIYQTIVIAPDNSNLVLGVAWSFGETPQLAARVSNLNGLNYCPASTGMYIGVITDPTVVYEIEDNGTTLTASQIGSWFQTSSNASGSTTTGNSSAVLDQGDMTTTGPLAWRVLRLVNRPDNILGANAKWEVILQRGMFGHNIDGTGYHTT